MKNTVKGYKIDFANNTLYMNYKFAQAANNPQSEEYRLVAGIKKDFPKIKVITRAGRKQTTCNSPFKILINEGNFYLLAYNGKHITTYRIDRMDNVIKSIELREGAEFYKDINMQDFTKRVFSMFGGEEKNVTIRFTKDLLDIVIDRFGANGASYTPDDDKHFKIRVNVEVSNMFYSWICGFRKKATILNPPEVVEDFKNFLADINQKYESC